jgi:glycolate oxidase FAD binding subunit
MSVMSPTTARDLAAALRDARDANTRVRLGGAFTKDAMAGDVRGAALTLSTRCLNRVLAYEPRDLTISVEAGLPWAELTRTLAERGQMIPLDPPLAATATVGGVVAANTAGPRRRQYGTPRDFVIGMTYATVDGVLAQSGGMVVKNVAGLDVQKVLIGSFGTLAAITTVNLRVVPRPGGSRTFVLSHDTADQACESRTRIMRTQLQPVALDVLNEAAARLCGLEGHVLLLRAQGSPHLLDRYSREIEGASILEGEPEESLWRRVENLAPAWIEGGAERGVIRVAHLPSALAQVMRAAPGPLWARGANGVAWLGCDSRAAVESALHTLAAPGREILLEWSTPRAREGLDLWPRPGDTFEVMRQLKEQFDPAQILNPGRLHGRF